MGLTEVTVSGNFVADLDFSARNKMFIQELCSADDFQYCKTTFISYSNRETLIGWLS